MKDNRMKDALENIARRGVPENTNLWPRIKSRIDQRNSFMQNLRARPVMAIVIVMFALSLLTGVVYAIGKSLGYIPGVGIIDQSTPLRILAEPVVAERDGLTVTVSQVVADSDHTFVAYAIDGIFWPKKGGWPMCGVLPSLQFPDGATLNVISGGEGPRGGRVGYPMNFETTVSYPPIPSGVSNVTFNFPCILTEGTGPENWQIPLELSPAPKDYATPGVEIGVTFVATNPKVYSDAIPNF